MEKKLNNVVAKVCPLYPNTTLKGKVSLLSL